LIGKNNCYIATLLKLNEINAMYPAGQKGENLLPAPTGYTRIHKCSKWSPKFRKNLFQFTRRIQYLTEKKNIHVTGSRKCCWNAFQQVLLWLNSFTLKSFYSSNIIVLWMLSIFSSSLYNLGKSFVLFSLESQCFPGTLKLSGKQNYFPREKTLSVHV
jgi:hypothetical protein